MSRLLSTLIGVCGDLHGFHKREALEVFIAETGIELLLSVGDLQDYRPFPLPTYFVRGNHESWPILEELRVGSRTPTNLHYLADGMTLTIEGHTIVGIGGNWSPTDRARSRHIPHDYLAAMTRSRPDLVLSHETPLRYADRPELCCEPLREALFQMRPRFWFSGHHHRFATESIGRTEVFSLGKYPDEWVTFRLERRHIGPAVRHQPADPGYAAARARWQALETQEKALLLPLDRANGGGAIYGVTDIENVHARSWFGRHWRPETA
jgi:hypothetical protein